MSLPFTQEQFLSVFKSYNLAVWPMQIVAYVLAGVVLIMLLTSHAKARQATWSLLAFFWLWNGVVYHLLFFRDINGAAIGFGLLFLIQSGLFVWAGAKRPDLYFRSGTTLRTLVGSVLLLYAMLAYPLIGMAQGRGYPFSPSFGLTPCPMVIFTFGLLLWVRGGVPLYILVIPFLWALIGSSAAFHLGIPEDLGLLVAGLVGGALSLLERFRSKNSTKRGIGDVSRTRI